MIQNVMKKVIAKFVCQSLTDVLADQTTMVAVAVTSGSEENTSFSRWTPSGDLKLVISNELPARHFFEEGKEFYLEMIDCSNSGLPFGRALEALKQGKRVAREGWNGKGMFIFMRPADKLPIEMVVDKVKSLPQSVKDYYLQDILDDDGNRIPSEQINSDDVVEFTPYLCMKSADGKVVNGWLTSQTDMLSEDWLILD